MSDDERYGAPSASAMKRIANCPPSHRMGAQFKDEGDADSTHGDRVHKALELGDSTGLSADEAETFEMCRDQRIALLDEWLGEEQGYTVHKEVRLVMTPLNKVFDDGATKVKVKFSGKADYVAVFGEGALVVDYKTLHGDHAHATVNEQLRSLAVLVWLRHGVSQVRVAIVQPWKGRPTVADFDLPALEAAKAWLLEVLKREARATEDDAVAGEWCKYCTAKLACRAFSRPMMYLAERVGNESSEVVEAKLKPLANAELANLMTKYVPRMEMLVAAVKKEAFLRAMYDEQFSSTFFHIVESKPKEAIDDVSKVWSKLEKLGVNANDFTRECKTSKKAVTALTRAVTGFKGKELQAAVDRCLEGATKAGAVTKKLVAVGGTIEDDGEEDAT